MCNLEKQSRAKKLKKKQEGMTNDTLFWKKKIQWSKRITNEHAY